MLDTLTLETQLSDLLDASLFNLSTLKPSEWAEQHRVMTSDISRFVGKFSYDRTPYLREIVDCLSPNHPARIAAVIKGAQIGFNAGVIENGIAWIISQNPGPILFLSGHDDLVEEAIGRIDQAIQTCGLRDLIRPNIIKRKNQKTGDTGRKKEFAGGSLVSGSASNHKMLRFRSTKFGFINDFEAAKAATKEAGATTKMIEKRFTSFGDTMKLIYDSSPELKQNSNIEKVYLLGDQRKWHIPCPCCGAFITLEWTVPLAHKPEEKGGITWKLDENNRLMDGSVGYICQQCGDFFTDSRKDELNLLGRWIPTAEPSQMGYYSYHISSLYAPAGMFDWAHYVRDYLEANPPDAPQKVAEHQSFVNLVLGQTFEATSEAPQANILQKFNIRSYEPGTVPEALSIRDGNGSIILITLACDLNGLPDDSRLDYEVLAWSESGASYSITHGSLGTFVPRENTLVYKPDRQKWNYYRGSALNVWAELDKLLETIYTTDTGRRMRIYYTGIDTGYCDKQAWDYIDNWRHSASHQLVSGLKGDKEETYVRHGIDLPTFKIGKERGNLYLVQGPLIKDDIAELMKLRWDKSSSPAQPSGFMNFPSPADGKYRYDNYFAHYESEHRVSKTEANLTVSTRWEKKTSVSQNHLWDCRVYNHAVRDIVVYETAKYFKVPNGKWTWKDYVDAVKQLAGK